MNKTKSKALKKLSKLLPTAYMIRDHSEAARLSELYEFKDKGHNVGELPELNPTNKDRVVVVKSPALEQINHYRRLKKAYQDGQTKGVQKYLIWLRQHNAEWMKKETELNVEKLDDNIFRIAQLNVKSFWTALIAFLFAFVQVFQRKDKNA